MTLMTRWLLLLGFAPLCVANERLHKYNVGERVNLWVNRVGPYHNPQETYNYYKLPFCHPDLGLEAKKKSLTIGETLEGHDLTNSGYEIHFAQDLQTTKSCTLTLGKNEVEQFSNAVSAHYWYQMYLDDLPIWGMVGEVFKGKEQAAQTDKVKRHPLANKRGACGLTCAGGGGRCARAPGSTSSRTGA
jgi:transmembrane 9 superfamily protein 3